MPKRFVSLTKSLSFYVEKILNFLARINCSYITFLHHLSVSIYLRNSTVARRQHFGSCDIYIVEREGRGGHLAVLLAAAQEGRKNRKSTTRSRKS